MFTINQSLHQIYPVFILKNEDGIARRISSAQLNLWQESRAGCFHLTIFVPAVEIFYFFIYFFKAIESVAYKVGTQLPQDTGASSCPNTSQSINGATSSLHTCRHYPSLPVCEASFEQSRCPNLPAVVLFRGGQERSVGALKPCRDSGTVPTVAPKSNSVGSELDGLAVIQRFKRVTSSSPNYADF